MNDIFARQVVSRGYFRLPCRLLVSLNLHDLRAFITEAEPGKRVDAVVYTVMKRLKASEQRGVSGIDDCVAFKRGDVALLQINITFDGRKIN